MGFDAEHIRQSLGNRDRIARILVVAASGSVPRDAGTSMIVWKDGQSGTIGGGELEFRMTRQARRLISDRLPVPRVVKLPLGPSLGQCCGGSITLLIEPFGGDLPVDHRLDTGNHHYSCRSLAGSEASERPAIESLLRKNSLRVPRIIDNWIIEPRTRTPYRLWIFGAGHVGRALVDVMLPTERFKLAWIDIDSSRFPDPVPAGVERLIAVNPARLACHAPDGTDHLVLTHSHTLDLDLCNSLLKTGFASLGLIGSRTKWRRFRKRLLALDNNPERVDAIKCPIGMKALGKHPQAIAVGVAADLLARRPPVHGG